MGSKHICCGGNSDFRKSVLLELEPNTELQLGVIIRKKMIVIKNYYCNIFE